MVEGSAVDAATSGPFVLGVDGGATKTVGVRAGLTGPGVLRAEVGPTNLHAADGHAVADNLRAVIDALCTDRVPRVAPEATVLGVAGAGRPEDVRRMVELARSAGLRGRLTVTTDASVALHGATGGRPGILVIAGTGSICYGRAADRREARAGGWGHILDDAGSGYGIGLAAVRVLVRQADGRARRTALHDAVLAAIETDIDGVVAWAASASKAEVAALATTVLDAAAAGDRPAAKILAAGARDLADLVAAVAAKLGGGSAQTVVLSGGLLAHDGPYRRQVSAEMSKRRADVRIEQPAAEPAWGAVLMAREIAAKGNAHGD